MKHRCVMQHWHMRLVCTPAQVVLCWVMQKDFVTCPIIGAMNLALPSPTPLEGHGGGTVYALL